MKLMILALPKQDYVNTHTIGEQHVIAEQNRSRLRLSQPF